MITPAYAANIGAQKIDGLLLETYGMALARFPLPDNLGSDQFFVETFLLADTSMEVVLECLSWPLVMQTFS